MTSTSKQKVKNRRFIFALISIMGGKYPLYEKKNSEMEFDTIK
jgi:hypothetical protein